jgi:hypothetical protein
MANSPDTSGNLAVDAHFKSHETLWDNTWGERFVEGLHRAGWILPPGIDLMLAWKAANYTHGEPLLLVSGVSRFFSRVNQ